MTHNSITRYSIWIVFKISRKLGIQNILISLMNYLLRCNSWRRSRWISSIFHLWSSWTHGRWTTAKWGRSHRLTAVSVSFPTPNLLALLNWIVKSLAFGKSYPWVSCHEIPQMSTTNFIIQKFMWDCLTVRQIKIWNHGQIQGPTWARFLRMHRRNYIFIFNIKWIGELHFYV